MGRNVVSQGTPDRSFAGLMDHLTGFSRESASGSDAGSDFGATFRRTSRPDSEVIDGALTNPRNGARPMLPVTERKPGRTTPQADASALSYEKALQIHGRHRSPPSGTVTRTAPSAQDRQGAAPEREKTTVGVRNSALNTKAVANQPKAQASPPKSDASATRNGAKPNLQAARIAKPPVAAPVLAETENRQRTVTVPVGGSANPVAGVRSSSPGLGATAVRQRKKAAVATSSVPPSAAKATRRATARQTEIREAPKTQGKSRSARKLHHEVTEEAATVGFRSVPSHNPASERGAVRGQVQPPETGVGWMESEPPGSQLELLHELSQLDQRRTIVSVRLTEGEFACLRDRAEESGISVSAYMRSCVVDADQLRAQVKRALAEMRSLSGSAASDPGTALTAPLHGAGDPSGWNPHGWFRLVLRPLAFLFGPLFPARRSA